MLIQQCLQPFRARICPIRRCLSWHTSKRWPMSGEALQSFLQEPLRPLQELASYAESRHRGCQGIPRGSNLLLTHQWEPQSASFRAYYFLGLLRTSEPNPSLPSALTKTAFRQPSNYAQGVVILPRLPKIQPEFPDWHSDYRYFE